MRATLCLLLTILMLNLQAQECNLIEGPSDKWVLMTCREENADFDNLTLDNNLIFSYPELKIKVTDDVFFNIVLILPNADKNPYYAIELLFIDDANDKKVSLFKGVPYVQLKMSESNVAPPYYNSQPFFAYKGATKYNDIPLRTAIYCFALPLNILQSMFNIYKSTETHLMKFELLYGNKTTNKDYETFGYLGKDNITHLLSRIMAITYKRK